MIGNFHVCRIRPYPEGMPFTRSACLWQVGIIFMHTGTLWGVCWFIMFNGYFSYMGQGCLTV